MNSNGFPLFRNRYCVLFRSHSSPKFAIWHSKNSGFVVFAMPPKTLLCGGRRPRSIHQGVVVAADFGSDPQIGRIWGCKSRATSHKPQRTSYNCTLHLRTPAAVQQQVTSQQPPAANFGKGKIIDQFANLNSR